MSTKASPAAPPPPASLAPGFVEGEAAPVVRAPASREPAGGFVAIGSGEVSEGGAFVPVEGQLGRGGLPATKIESCAAFLLRAHQQRWTVSGGAIVPLFGKIKFLGGLNGATDVRDRNTNQILRVNPSMARASSEEAGWVTIPFDAIPPSHRVPAYHNHPSLPASYLWKPKGRPDVNLLIYERCYPGSTRIDRDDKGFLEFCTYLQEKGIIAPPPVYVLRQMLEDATARAAKWTDIAQKNTHMSRTAQQMALNVEVIEAAIRARESALADSQPADGEAFDPSGE